MSSRGILLIEAALVILFLAVLSVSLAPSVMTALDDARVYRARHDLKTITAAMTRLVDDVWGQRAVALSRHAVLVGPGAAPAGTGPATAGWRSVDARRVGELNDHLVTNPGYPAFSAQTRGWRGPYVEGGVEADPWAGRYAVNTTALFEPGLDTVAVSAGPDGRIETPFLGDSLVAAGDDVLIIVFSTGRTVNR